MLRIHILVHDQVQHYGAQQLLQLSIEGSILEQARNILNIAALMDARSIPTRVTQITGSPHHLHIHAILFRHCQNTFKGLFWQKLLPQVCIGPTLSVLQAWTFLAWTRAPCLGLVQLLLLALAALEENVFPSIGIER
jgi:hypothetical protein